jgi:hypothetical protein
MHGATMKFKEVNNLSITKTRKQESGRALFDEFVQE